MTFKTVPVPKFTPFGLVPERGPAVAMALAAATPSLVPSKRDTAARADASTKVCNSFLVMNMRPQSMAKPSMATIAPRQSVREARH